MTATRCVLYLRVSLDATGERLAITRQRDACREIAAARGWTVVAEYVDNSISAFRKEKQRPAYNKMVAAYQAGEFDALLCWDLDRLTRQPRQLEDWIDAAEDDGFIIVTANGEADLSHDNGRLFARIKAGVARAESERKASRQRAALRQRAEAGKAPLGRRLTGYASDGTVIEAEAAIVREIFARFYDGDSLLGIAAWLNGQGVPARSGRPWRSSTVRGILANPRYAGRCHYNRRANGDGGTWVPGKWPALVEDWLFDVVQADLAAPARRTQRGTSRKHLGSGLYLCGVCGAPVRATGGRANRSDNQRRYRCPAGHVTRTAARVDELVLLAVRDALDRPQIAALMADPGTGAAREAAADIRRLNGRLRQAQHDYDADLIDGIRYKAKTARIQAELDEAEAKLARTAHGPGAALAGPDPVAAFDAAPLAVKRSVVSHFMTVRLAKAPRGYGFDPATVEVEWKRY